MSPDQTMSSAIAAIENRDIAAFARHGEACLEARLPPARLVQLAIKARQAGFAGEGAALLRRFAERNAATPEAVFFELAFHERLAGRHRAAADLLETALRAPGAGFRTGLHHAHMLFAAGAPAEAAASLALLAPASPQEANSLRVMAEFGAYLQAHPLEAVASRMAELKTRSGWLGQSDVTERILQAVGARKPFSLIRLGDGEGAFLRLDDADEATYPTLYDANRDNRMAMWFGAAFDWRKNGFFEETQNLVGAVHEADIVAVPDLPWLTNSYAISSISGVPSLANIVRCFTGDTGLGTTAFATASIAKELHLKARYDTIFAAVRRVSVISCLPDLPALLRAYFGLEIVHFIQIPGEQGSRLALGEGVQFGAHYPDVFHRLQSELSRPWEGEIVLIAGGMLGKLYAGTIRRHGGIALDIGSLADRWLGKKTRPGDDPRYQLIAKKAVLS